MYACIHIQTCIWDIWMHIRISYEGMYLCISYFIMDSVCTGIHIHIYTYNIRVYFWTLLWSNVCRVCVLVRTCIYQYTNTPVWINIRPYMYTCVFNRDRCRTYIHICIRTYLSFFLVINRYLFIVKTVRKSTWTSFGCVEVDSRVVSLVLGCGDKYYVLNTALLSIVPLHPPLEGLSEMVPL